MTVAAKVLLRDVIRDKENEIRLVRGKRNTSPENQEKKEGYSHRISFINLTERTESIEETGNGAIAISSPLF